MSEIKNIIFDLGGVIINLDQSLTIHEFNKISAIPFEEVYTQTAQTELFNDFDKGKISDFEFFSELRKQIRYEGPEVDLLYAWNAMLLDVPEKRLDLLVNMKQNYNTFLLSNTCEPHIACFEKELYIHHGVKNFNDYFDRVYYSCRMGMRKPHREIFELVLKENELVPEETVFIDDSIQHVKGAGECGIKAYLLPKDMEVGDLLKELNLL
ncbi:HAD family hydrolase [Aurantibacillus circumpalustris]|uniref:HAD family hydrolase n=1 Tax=Aurantibacillus circumpalustris TaxID=3036359 RepID=UPI00295A9905|nr:HAD family phosphatase [Aurantibacillus circumpalustris]